jgi:hypothetical protein
MIQLQFEAECLIHKSLNITILYDKEFHFW